MWTQGKAQLAARLSAALLSLRTLCLLALWMMGAVSAAQAQEALSIEVVPEPELLCMTPGARERSDVPYPEELLRMRESGDIRVALTFNAADASPKVKLQVAPAENAPTEAFVKAVEKHVAKFRVPCHMSGDKPFVTTFRFLFTPDLGLSPVQRAALFGPSESCLVRGQTKVSYPSGAQKRGLQGVVYASFKFTAPDQPPEEVRILNEDSVKPFVQTVRNAVSAFRMPCLEPGEVKTSKVVYNFKLEDGPRARLNDMDLVSFLGTVKDLDKQSYKVDFAEVGCPFDVTFELNQPYMSNKVVVHKRSPGNFLDERAVFVFMDWVRKLELNMPDSQRAQILGQESIIHVPCIKLDI
jgi:hypothetical protein